VSDHRGRARVLLGKLGYPIRLFGEWTIRQGYVFAFEASVIVKEQCIARMQIVLVLTKYSV
jgi:hypothetical protein